MKRRILNERLAAIVASLRHGEMLFIADAGSGTSAKALYPLDPSVEYLDLEAVTGSPSFQDIAGTLVEVGDFESAIVTGVMPEVNPKDYEFVVSLFGENKVAKMNYIPDYYELRERCQAVIQTGDYGAHAQAILVAGYPSDDIPVDWLLHGIKRRRTEDGHQPRA